VKVAVALRPRDPPVGSAIGTVRVVDPCFTVIVTLVRVRN